MRDCVVVKWGGSLITDKEHLCTAKLDIIKSLSNVVKQCVDSGLDVILVHGAGSFGHLRAKHWRLNEGLLPGVIFDSQNDCESQEQAISMVRNEMLTLNKYIVESLDNVGLEAVVSSPHEWVRNIGSNFDGDIIRNFSYIKNSINITHGDVVECDGDRNFGILSGDDLVVRLCKEIPNVKRLVFAIGGVDGILKRPPHVASKDDLIEEWSPGMKFIGIHDQDIDVTGGIGLKAARGAEVAKAGIHVSIVNGKYPDRVLSACMGNDFLGTTIIA
jgi:isopentenyl phosphate kinase